MSSQSGPAVSVLLVDDDRSLSSALGEYLESQGFLVTICETCQQAVQLLSSPEQRFQILLCDLRLPDGDGMDVIKASREREQALLTAVMTGYASLETALEAIRLGAYDYITKPFSLDEIDILIKNMCDKLRLLDENRLAQEKLHQVYSRMELLQDEKLELLRVHREMRKEFDDLSHKMDQVIHLLRMLLANHVRGGQSLPFDQTYRS